jgi:hypothetical protein
MTSVLGLWLPILLSAVLVFVASSLIHMVLPWHKSDYPRLANEDALRDALRPLALPPGDYFVPRPATRDDLKSPEFAEKVKQGPVFVMTVMPNASFSMGRNLSMWFVYCLVVSLFAAYVASRTLAPGTPYPQVFRITGVTAFVGYALALWQMSIWYRRAWSLTIKATFDGLVYAMLSAGAFGWLWPR